MRVWIEAYYTIPSHSHLLYDFTFRNTAHLIGILSLQNLIWVIYAHNPIWHLYFYEQSNVKLHLHSTAATVGTVHAGCLMGQNKIYILNLTFTHKCMSRLCTQTAKHSQRDTITSRAMWYLSTLCCMFMQFATISVQRFEKCSRLQYISPCTCLCCVLPGALTLLDILKSRQPISSSSHHLKGNECHLIEIGSLSLQRSNIISDVYLLFGAAFSFRALNCTGLWLPQGLLMQKSIWCFQTISCACCKFSVHISFAPVCPSFM